MAGPTQKLQSRLPRLLRFGPSRFGSSRKRSPSGSSKLPLGLLRRFSLWCRPFDLGPPCFLSRTHLGSGGSTELPLLLGGFSCGSFNRTAQELTKFLLQRLDLLLEIGGFT